MQNRRVWTVWAALLAALLCVGLLGGCAQEAAPSAATPSPEPAQDQPEISPAAGSAMAEQRTVPLYFRMQGEALLARETRTLRIPYDKQPEAVIIEALIDGPSASLLDLVGVFNAGTRVSVSASGSTLTVILSRSFLDTPSDAPANWESDAAWRAEVLLRRRLALLSIVNAITESTQYTAVQLLVRETNDLESAGVRVPLSTFTEEVDDETALLGPVTRDEASLLTHHNTAQAILESWHTRDFERMYRFVAQMDGDRPAESEFLLLLAAMPGSLSEYSLSPGSVSADGQTAILTADITRSDEGGQWRLENYPLCLTLENGLWKIPYATLLRMLEATQ